MNKFSRVSKWAAGITVYCAVLAMVLFSGEAGAARLGKLSNAMGFGSVIPAGVTNAIAISSSYGMSMANANGSCQIGVGSNATANSIQYRTWQILDGNGSIPIERLGGYFTYVRLDEDFTELVGYVANNLQTNAAGEFLGQLVFSEHADTSPWLLTVVDGGTDEDESIVMDDDAPNGWLKATTTDAALDCLNAQLNGESFRLLAGKKLWFKSSFLVEDVSMNDVAVGLTVAETDLLDSPPADGFWFEMNHDGNLDFHVEQDSTNYTFDTGVDMGDITNVSVVVIWDGVDTLSVTVNSVLISNVVASSDDICIPTDEALSPIWAVQTTNASTAYIMIDYIGIVAERQTPFGTVY